MALKYEIDNLDLNILTYLQKDGRVPFSDLARKLGVSGGTIHQRVEKLRESKIITGSKICLDYKKLGHQVVVLLGLHLNSAKSIEEVIEKIGDFNEVVEAYYTTGNYALILKVLLRDIDHYHSFLVKKIQSLEHVQSTESFICLDMPINKDIHLGK